MASMLSSSASGSCAATGRSQAQLSTPTSTQVCHWSPNTDAVDEWQLPERNNGRQVPETWGWRNRNHAQKGTDARLNLTSSATTVMGEALAHRSRALDVVARLFTTTTRANHSRRRAEEAGAKE